MKHLKKKLTPEDKDFIAQLLDDYSQGTIKGVIEELTSRGLGSPPEKYLTREEAAALIRISLPTLDKRIENGLPVRRIGKKLLFTEREIDEFLKRNRTG
jgi:excisionase family DNA binding protein